MHSVGELIDPALMSVNWGALTGESAPSRLPSILTTGCDTVGNNDDVATGFTLVVTAPVCMPWTVGGGGMSQEGEEIKYGMRTPDWISTCCSSAF